MEIITSQTKYPAPFTHRILILCAEKNIPYTLTKIDTENKPDWFLQIAPLGLVPVMRIENHVIFDSHAICEYLDKSNEPPLLPADLLECAKHKSWMAFADDLAQEIARLVKQGNIHKADLTHLNVLLNILNENIKGTYFYGEEISLVDIYLISHLLWIDSLEETVLPNAVIKKFPHVSTWLKTMKQQSSIKNTMGEDYAKHFIELLQQYHLIPKQ